MAKEVIRLAHDVAYCVDCKEKLNVNCDVCKARHKDHTVVASE